MARAILLPRFEEDRSKQRLSQPPTDKHNADQPAACNPFHAGPMRYLFYLGEEGPRGDPPAEVGKKVLPHEIHRPLAVEELLGGPDMRVVHCQKPTPEGQEQQPG